MEVRSLIHSFYETITTTDRIPEIVGRLVQHSFLVVLRDGVPDGVFIVKDLPAGLSGIVGDCHYSKPILHAGNSVQEGVQYMLESGNDTLPVYEYGIFAGVVTLNSLSRGLLQQARQSELNFQHTVHDLRNPVGNLMGLFQILEDNLESKAERELTWVGKRECSSALDLLGELLDHEKKLHQNLAETLEINQFITDCCDELKGMCHAKRIRISVNPMPEVCQLATEQKPLKRAICNLLSNANKYSPEKAEIIVSLFKSGEGVIIKIQDQGIGIPATLQPFIFDRFTQAARSGTAGEHSTGLGLFFVRETINRLGGQISFTSEEGTGTTFSVELPVNNECR